MGKLRLLHQFPGADNSQEALGDSPNRAIFLLDCMAQVRRRLSAPIPVSGLLTEEKHAYD